MHPYILRADELGISSAQKAMNLNMSHQWQRRLKILAALGVLPVGQRGDYFPLHGVDEAALGVLCTLLGSPVQETHKCTGKSPTKCQIRCLSNWSISNEERLKELQLLREDCISLMYVNAWQRLQRRWSQIPFSDAQ